jgi:4-hydroxy-tetrahydrodipicolinate reductase
MKVALLGSGKSGCEVAKLHENTVIFNRSNPITLPALKECDIVISFLPGDVFEPLISLLIESNLPVVTGSTGFEWEQDKVLRINSQKTSWIRAHNFSLGMNLVKSMIETLSKATELYPDATFNIHDIHHTKKIDSPSGTAISWRDWLKKDADITAERIGDVVGYHHLEMKSQVEQIKITHEAKDRAIFASGALWAARAIISEPNRFEGLNDFDKVVKTLLNI